MALTRLQHAIATGEIALPEAGTVALWGAAAGGGTAPLEPGRCHVITGFYPDYEAFRAAGIACSTGPEGRYTASVVVLPRARELARNRVATAVAVTDGPVWVSGDKTNGVEAMLRECRARGPVTPVISKSHGKLFALPDGVSFADWRTDASTIEGGFVTSPGVFSADGPDPASVLLAAHLPERLGARVVDLGAGWGYLGAQILTRADLAHLDLVEAEYTATECARQNVRDPRARIHWQDATRWRPDSAVDAVVTNPPFHSGRAADPGLGQAFIRSAAAMLKPSGSLWLVANRHLPYEAEMTRHFKVVTEIAGDIRFKILHGSRVVRTRG